MGVREGLLCAKASLQTRSNLVSPFLVPEREGPAASPRSSWSRHCNRKKRTPEGAPPAAPCKCWYAFWTSPNVCSGDPALMVRREKESANPQAAVSAGTRPARSGLLVKRMTTSRSVLANGTKTSRWEVFASAGAGSLLGRKLKATVSLGSRAMAFFQECRGKYALSIKDMNVREELLVTKNEIVDAAFCLKFPWVTAPTDFVGCRVRPTLKGRRDDRGVGLIPALRRASVCEKKETSDAPRDSPFSLLPVTLRISPPPLIRPSLMVLSQGVCAKL